MHSAAEELPASERNASRIPYGLMSLLEMINCSVSSLCALCSQLMLEEIVREEKQVCLDVHISDAEKQAVKEWLKIATDVANDFEWKPVHDRIEIIRRKLEKRMSNRELATELRVLRETIHSGLKGELIYRYEQDKKYILLNWKNDWAAALKSFPSAEEDILAGVDLWALGHATASVFHFMRVLEHGLRALAKDVGINFDVQSWGQIIDQIESEISTLRDTLPRGLNKNDRLRFLSEAAKEFVYFKDGWRNYVSHNRASYDEYQARSVMEHVKSFGSS